MNYRFTGSVEKLSKLGGKQL